MTRKEQITDANPYGDSSEIAYGKRIGFVIGAEWADAHPENTWVNIEDELPPYNKELLLLNNRNKNVECQIFNDGYDIKTYCCWYCISYWKLANFPE